MTSGERAASDHPKPPEGQPPSGLAVALELFELGRALRGQRHRREFPNATESEVEVVVHAWEVDRPGAPFGDAIGRPISWPRS